MKDLKDCIMLNVNESAFNKITVKQFKHILKDLSDSIDGADDNDTIMTFVRDGRKDVAISIFNTYIEDLDMTINGHKMFDLYIE